MIEKQDKPVPRRSPLVPVALGICVVGWVLLAVVLINFAQVCGAGPTNWWLQSAIGCMRLNEYGDFLAGFFAPLATIFLAYAVYVQSVELKAQQYELNQTKEIFRDQTDLLRQQIDTEKGNQSFIQKQTELLHDQEQEAKKLRADTELKEELQTLRNMVEDTWRSIDLHDARVPSVEAWFMRLCNELVKLHPEKAKYFLRSDPLSIAVLIYSLLVIASLEPRLSNAKRRFLRNSSINVTITHLRTWVPQSSPEFGQFIISNMEVYPWLAKIYQDPKADTVTAKEAKWHSEMQEFDDG